MRFKVWHIPQVPMKPFEVHVDSPEEGFRIAEILAEYDLFQYENKVKPDYTNASGVAVLLGAALQDGDSGWCDIDESDLYGDRWWEE